MCYLLDSNVLSELTRKALDPGVAGWVRDRPVAAIDSLLAATAQQHGLILVTRHVRDVADLGVQVLNPWLD